MSQDDLFPAAPRQPDLFGATAQSDPYQIGDRARIRRKLNAVLDQLRGATEMPWDEDRLGWHQVVFPQMLNWLDEQEGAQLRLEFETEVKRLAKAA